MSSYNNIDPIKTGKFILELRVAHNLTQEELGFKVFISRKSISKWETGRCCPSIDMVKKLSDVLGVSMEELIAGKFLNGNCLEDAVKKVNYNKRVAKSNVAICVCFSILIMLLIIFNLNKTNSFSINYEDDNFTIINGKILFSRDDSYINLGKFYSDFPNTDDETDYKFSLYLKDEEEEDFLISFNSIGTDITDRMVLTKVYNSLIRRDNNNLYMGIKFVDNENQERDYSFKLDLTLNKEIRIMGVTTKNEAADSLLDNDITELDGGIEGTDISEGDEINYLDVELDVSFIYETSKEDIKKLFHNKKVITDNDSYIVTYEEEGNIIFAKGRNNNMIIYLDNDRIDDSENYLYIVLDNKTMLNSIRNAELIRFLKALKNVFLSNIR